MISIEPKRVPGLVHYFLAPSALKSEETGPYFVFGERGDQPTTSAPRPWNIDRGRFRKSDQPYVCKPYSETFYTDSDVPYHPVSSSNDYELMQRAKWTDIQLQHEMLIAEHFMSKDTVFPMLEISEKARWDHSLNMRPDGWITKSFSRIRNAIGRDPNGLVLSIDVYNVMRAKLFPILGFVPDEKDLAKLLDIDYVYVARAYRENMGGGDPKPIWAKTVILFYHEMLQGDLSLAPMRTFIHDTQGAVQGVAIEHRLNKEGGGATLSTSMDARVVAPGAAFVLRNVID